MYAERSSDSMGPLGPFEPLGPLGPREGCHYMRPVVLAPSASGTTAPAPAAARSHVAAAVQRTALQAAYGKSAPWRRMEQLDQLICQL